MFIVGETWQDANGLFVVMSSAGGEVLVRYITGSLIAQDLTFGQVELESKVLKLVSRTARFSYCRCSIGRQCGCRSDLSGKFGWKCRTCGHLHRISDYEDPLWKTIGLTTSGVVATDIGKMIVQLASFWDDNGAKQHWILQGGRGDGNEKKRTWKVRR